MQHRHACSAYASGTVCDRLPSTTILRNAAILAKIFWKPSMRTLRSICFCPSRHDGLRAGIAAIRRCGAGVERCRAGATAGPRRLRRKRAQAVRRARDRGGHRQGRPGRAGARLRRAQARRSGEGRRTHAVRDRLEHQGLHRGVDLDPRRRRQAEARRPRHRPPAVVPHVRCLHHPRDARARPAGASQRARPRRRRPAVLADHQLQHARSRRAPARRADQRRIPRPVRLRQHPVRRRAAGDRAGQRHVVRTVPAHAHLRAAGHGRNALQQRLRSSPATTSPPATPSSTSRTSGRCRR